MAAIHQSRAHISQLRKGFHAGCVPVYLAGIGGPGAPHVFSFHRRNDPDLQGHVVQNQRWGYAEHPHDVVLRYLGARYYYFFAAHLANFGTIWRMV